MRMPACLTTRKLVFGDEEQIKAVNALQADFIAQENERAAVEAGELSVFTISVSIDVEREYTITAKNEDAAIEDAREQFSDELDVSWDVGVDVRRVQEN